MVGIVVIVWGVLVGLGDLIRVKVSRVRAKEQKLASLGRVRYDLGYHLLLGLEFLIADDIIRTIIEPTLEELAILGAAIAIRVVLSYFLHREISHMVTSV